MKWVFRMNDVLMSTVVPRSGKVVHQKKEHYDVLISRPSKWGNPFVIGKDGTRKEVIQKYEEYLRNNQELMNQILELDGKVLGCWCSPLPCHGDVILKIIEEKKNTLLEY